MSDPDLIRALSDLTLAVRGGLQMTTRSASARGCLYYNDNEAAQFWMGLYRDELGKAVSVDRKVQAPATLTLKPSMVAGRPTPGIASGSAWYRRIRGSYS